MHRWHFASLTCVFLALCTVTLQLYFGHQARTLRENVGTDVDAIEPLMDQLSTKMDALEKNRNDNPNFKSDFQALQQENESLLKRADSILNRNRLADEYESIDDALTIATLVLYGLFFIFHTLWRRESRKLRAEPLVDTTQQAKETLNSNRSES